MAMAKLAFGKETSVRLNRELIWLISLVRATLSKMGFGLSFIRWVNLSYTGVLSAVNVNGYLSSFFPLSRGVRQGCPLSPLLYVLVSEVLAANIRANPRIIGLSLPGAPASLSPISQYADDTSLIVCSDDSIVASFETYARFEKGSGAKLNQSKSKGLWLGSWSGRLVPPVALDWTSVKIKVLGVFIGPRDLEIDNWRPRITAVENVLSSWKQRSLSYGGRALVINALALSRVWYVASLIHMPTWVLSELCKLVFDFFWKGKRDLVSRSVVVQSTCLGGFSVVDVKLKVWSLIVQCISGKEEAIADETTRRRTEKEIKKRQKQRKEIMKGEGNFEVFLKLWSVNVTLNLRKTRFSLAN